MSTFIETGEKIDVILMDAAVGLGKTVRSIKQWRREFTAPAWWLSMAVKRQQNYVKQLRDDISFTKRDLSHLQSVQSEENRKLIKMQMRLV